MRAGLGLGLSRQRGIGGIGHVDANYVSYERILYPANITYGSHIDSNYFSYNRTVYPGTVTAAGANPIGYDDFSSGSVYDPDSPGTLNITDLTVANNANRLLVVGIGLFLLSSAPETYITSVTWAGNNLGQRIQTNIVKEVDSRILRLYLFDVTGSSVTTGNNTLAVSWGGSITDPVEVAVIVGSYYNVTPGLGYHYTKNEVLSSTEINNSVNTSGNDDLIVVFTNANTTSGLLQHDEDLTEIEWLCCEGNHGMSLSHDLISGSGTFPYTESHTFERTMTTIAASYSNI